MNRRSFLRTSAAGALAAGTGGGLLYGLGLAETSPRPLPLIPLRDLSAGLDGRVPLRLGPGVHDFGTGAASATYGIGSPYLGPVLRVRNGQTLPADVFNGLEETVALHWHGLHIPGAVDGGPHQEIEPGATWSPDVPIAQRASMNWFHSHTHGTTARQTYSGLAGVLLVEDDDSLAAYLPKTYGVDDFTLVLQDKAFDDDGRMTYELTGQVFEDGFEADVMVVNGAIAPVAQAVPKGLIRLRVLNACNARFLRLSLDAGPLTVIASDGGFLGEAVETNVVVMSPGERYELLVDMRERDREALLVSFGDGADPLELIGDALGLGTEVLELRRTASRGFDGAPPRALASLPPPDRTQATVTREFVLNMGQQEDLAALAAAWGNFCGEGGMGINGRPMKMDRIDAEVRLGDTEIWRISSEDMLHPFHVHGCSFRILSQNGGSPPAYASGWKDMVHVEEGWSEILVKFDHPAPARTPYMFHCHILEHEDCGMMGQFTVG